MKPFELARPASLDEALAALAGAKDAAPLGGGADLINRMKEGVSSPSRLVALERVKGLAGIQGDAANGIVIGSATKLSDLLAHPAIKAGYPALWTAALEVATPQVRNSSTVGGNLCQRPRCWYYRAGFGLLGTQEGKSLVRMGDNRFHSVFMTDGDALFVSPSNLATALVALDAKLTIVGPNGERTVPAIDLYRVPKTEAEGELALAQGELLTRVSLPGEAGKSATYLVKHKQAHDWPLVGASVCVPGGDFAKSRVVLLGVAPVPYRSKSAEAVLARAQGLGADAGAAAGAAAIEGAKPLSKNGYKLALITTAVKRAVVLAGGGNPLEG